MEFDVLGTLNLPSHLRLAGSVYCRDNILCFRPPPQFITAVHFDQYLMGAWQKRVELVSAVMTAHLVRLERICTS